MSEITEKIERHITQYLQQLDDADSDDTPDKLENMQAKLEHFKQLQTQLAASGDTQIGTTDNDAKLLNKHTGKGPVAGYSLQIAVDDQHKLIAAHEVVNDHNDQNQLIPMIDAIENSLEVQGFTVLADSGYFLQDGIKESVERGIDTYIPVPKKCGKANNDGRYTRDDFTYDEAANQYICPAGKHLTWRRKINNDGHMREYYQSQSNDCRECPLKANCLGKKSTTRNVTRWEHEHVIEAYRQKMAEHGAEHMRRRSGLAEHPFGTMKNWMGWTHFLTRGFEKVRGEAALLVASYNFKRVIKILGLDAFAKLCENRLS